MEQTSPRVLRFDEIDSTNDTALELARHGEPEGTIVTARSQRKGRGRLGRSWWDRPGESALLSIILRPPLKTGELHQLAFVAGLGVAQWLEIEGCADVKLKWPNDVLLANKKVAGILVEADLSNPRPAVVVGIGVNVNQRDFPDELAYAATSVLIHTNRPRRIEYAVESIAEHVIAAYRLYLERGFKDILNCWVKLMWGVGLEVEARLASNATVGTIVGLDHSGALILEDSSGKSHALSAADSISICDRRITS